MAGVGPVPTPPGGVCDFPIYVGSLPLIPSKSPSVIVFTLAVGFYFLNGLWRDANMGGSNGVDSIFAAVTVIGLAVAQTSVIASQASFFSRCPPTDWRGLAMAWVVGILGGSIGFWLAYLGISAEKTAADIAATEAKVNAEKQAKNQTAIDKNRQLLIDSGYEFFSNSGPFKLTSAVLDLNSSGKSAAASSKDVPQTCAVPGAPGNNTMIFEAIRNGVVDNTIIAEPIA